MRFEPSAKRPEPGGAAGQPDRDSKSADAPIAPLETDSSALQLRHGAMFGVAARFTRREAQVLDSLLSGKSNKEMAQELACSVKTIEFHVSNIFKKTNVTSRAQLFHQLIKL